MKTFFIKFLITLCVPFIAAVTNATPDDCVSVYFKKAGDGDANISPYLKTLGLSGETKGSVYEFLDNVEKNKNNFSRFPVSKEQLSVLVACTDWVIVEGNNTDKQRLKTLYLAQVTGAGSLLQGARVLGDESTVRYAISIIESAIKKSDEYRYSLRESALMKEASDLASRIAPADIPMTDADVVVAVRDTLNGLLSPGASPGDDFYKYLSDVNAPVYQSMKLLTDASVAKERALALMERVIGTGNPSSLTEGNECSEGVPPSYDCSQLNVAEKENLKKSYKAWQETVKSPSPPSHGPSSYTRLKEMRAEIKVVDKKNQVDSKEPLCFSIKATDKCIPLQLVGVGDKGQLSWDARYPLAVEGNAPESMKQSIDKLVPFEKMDNDIKRFSKELPISLGKQGQNILKVKENQERAISLVNVLATWPKDNSPLPLKSNTNENTIGLEWTDTLTKEMSDKIKVHEDLKDLKLLAETSFEPSAKLRKTTPSVCFSSNQDLSFKEALQYEKLSKIRAEMISLAKKKANFAEVCNSVAKYLKPDIPKNTIESTSEAAQ